MHHLILIAALLAPVAHATELPDAIRRIILPQAMRVVLPPLGNEFIGMVRATSLASVIQYPEVL